MKRRKTLKSLLVVFTLSLHLSCSSTGLKQESHKQFAVLTILDVSDVKSPQILSSINLPSTVGKNNTVIVSGKYAYATTKHGLYIIDLSVPQNPVLTKAVKLPGEVNQLRLSGDYVYVGSNQGLHIVEVSNSNVVLTKRPGAYPNMPIKNLDIHDGYAYAMDSSNYLHILDLSMPTQPSLIESVTISPHWLLGVRANGPEVQLIQLPNSPSFFPEIWEALLNRKNLLEFHGWFDKVRVSPEHLAFVDSRRWESVAFARKSNSPMKGEFRYFYPEVHYLAYLYLTGKRALDYHTPTDVYVQSRSVVLVAQDEWSQKIPVSENLLGRIADIQLSGNLLYLASRNGIFLIANITENGQHKILSAIDSLAHQPVSLSLAGRYACVLGIIEPQMPS